MKKSLLSKFEALRKDCTALSDLEFQLVIHELVETTADFVDFNDYLGRAVYYSESAAESVANDLGLVGEDKLADVDFLTFEYCLFMGEL